MLKKSLSLMLIFSLVVLTVVPNFASAATNEGSKGDANNLESPWLNSLKDLGYSDEEIEKLMVEVEAINDYFEVDNNNNVTFNADDARKNGVDEQLVLRTEKDMEKINSNGKVTVDSIAKLDSCPGLTAYYGPQDALFLSDCAVDDITYWIGYGSNLTTIAGVLTTVAKIPGGPALTIAGVLVNMGVAAINHKNKGRGLVIFLRGGSTRVVAQ